jgi:hypothetical protein
MLVADGSEMNSYFSLMERMEQAHSQRRYYQALDYALEGVKWLPQVVKDTTKEFGRWDIKRSSPLEYACRHLAVLRRREDLHRIETVLKSVPELSEWLSQTDFALEQADLMDKIESLLAENPGFLQAKLGKTLGVEGRDVSSLMYCAEQLGLVRRDREGRSYRLFWLKA